MRLEAVFLLATLMQLPTDRAGVTLRGQVFLPEDREPAANFVVELVPVTVGASPGVRVKTDADGSFSVPGLLNGIYAIYPYALEGLYPRRASTFMSSSAEHVVVSGRDPVIEKNLLLPKPAATIEAVVVKGALPAPLERVILCHTDQPTRSATIQTDAQGHFRYVVPAEEQLSILVGAAGTQGNQVSNLLLKPEESRSLKIDLNAKAASGSGPPCMPFSRQ